MHFLCVENPINGRRMATYRSFASLKRKVSAVPLQQSIRDLGVAYENYFDSKGGKRKGPKIGLPQFKKKCHKQSARFTVSGFSLKERKVYLAKIGQLEVIWSRPLPSAPSSATIIKDPSGRYFLSFVVEIQPEIEPAKNESIGIDLGLKTFAAFSSGEKIDSPDFPSLIESSGERNEG